MLGDGLVEVHVGGGVWQTWTPARSEQVRADLTVDTWIPRFTAGLAERDSSRERG